MKEIELEMARTQKNKVRCCSIPQRAKRSG
jgi:hypothetical protein